MESGPKKIYFPGLNGLRFIAASFVVIQHVAQTEETQSFPYFNLGFLFHIGNNGVTLFFVLSGFLISYLLFSEKKFYGDISIKKFYLRRILRIWPLYYFVLLIGVFIFPRIPFMNVHILTDNIKNNFVWKMILYVFMLPNFVKGIFKIPMPFTLQAWSIGVEEQFYLIWPHVLKKSKNYLRSIVSVIIIYLVLRIILKILSRHYYSNMDIRAIKDIINYTRFDSLAIGALAGYYLFFGAKKIFDFIYRRSFQYILYLVTALQLIFAEDWFFNEEILAVLFALIILNIAANVKTVVNLEHKWLNYLGKISYGIYMYHIIIVTAVINFSLQFNNKENIGTGIFIYVLSLGLTVLVAGISYRYFESFFLKFKQKQSKIITGDDASKI